MGWLDDVLRLLAIILPFVIVMLLIRLGVWLAEHGSEEPLTEDEETRYRRMREEDREALHDAWNDEYEELTDNRVKSWREYNEQDSVQYPHPDLFQR